MIKPLILNQLQLVTPQVKEKIRKRSFLWTLLLFAILTFFYFPSSNQTYTTLTTVIHSNSLEGGFRGVYNSAWMGLLVVLFLHTVLIFSGIYFIRSSIRLDIDSKLDLYIKSSSLSLHRYFESKRLTNFMYLCFIAAAVEVMAIIMQFSRGESAEFVFLSYALPFLLLVIPFLYVLASLAVCLDMFNMLRNTVGNILIFVFSIGYLSYVLVQVDRDTINPYYDFSGLLFIVHNIIDQFVPAMALSQWDGGLGFLQNIDHYDNTFLMHKVNWEPDFIASRLVIIGLAFLLVHVVGATRSYDSIFYRKGATSKIKISSPKPVRQKIKMSDRSAAALVHNQSKSSAWPQTSTYFHVHLGALIRLEALIYRRSLEKTHLLLIPLFLIQFSPSSKGLDGVLFIFTSISPLFLFANITFKVKDLFIHTTLAYKQKYFISKIVFFTGCITLFFSGTILNLLLAQEYVKLIMLLTGLLFTVTLAIGCSFLSMHLFSFCYLFLWYLGVMQKLPVTDFFGINGYPFVSLSYAAVSVIILLFAYKRL
ncbi:hypothetical protein [Paenibacillus sp. GCM10012306]|uniref:hypothetical protein n=1 Tax=Paenibacillus sp. GCM10012306 TaxID=3317342 RepID=UPI0036163B67